MEITSLQPQLNQREMQVLVLAALGKSQSEIARTLFVSLDSVKNYNKTLPQKLGAPTITNAVFRAMRWQLIE